MLMSDQDKSLGLFQVVRSVLASFIGIQNDQTRERDFSRGRAKDFILVGVVLTLTFILVVWGMVQLAMSLGKA